MMFQILRANLSSLVWTSTGTSVCTCSSSTLCTLEPCFIAFVALTRPYLVRLYQYCNSHHAGDMMSVTDSGFFGGVRKRWMGVRVSLEGSTKGSGSGLSLEGRDATRRFSQRVSYVIMLRRNSRLTGEGRSVVLCVLQLDRRLRLLSSRFESVARAVEPDNG